MSAHPTPTLYGIPNCDTVKKARTWLQAQGVTHTFHDFKKQGLDAATVLAWTRQLPWDQVLNKRGTTWRQLSDSEQARATDAASAAALMAEHPSLVKRPVVAWPDGTVTVGFDADAWQARLAQG
ncbi:ArsC family reductase [Comamonas serinivorans]|uniref:ArsC family reductase n=1 Tax=Comamonas serinivorans TaxID=1082851 RepID=A0A1Y0ETY8_9BURK|nr:ArsC family reductase [Comamonas serinivorans]ARU06891.1 ArsC family reductase [Comamonas serinivorans]